MATTSTKFKYALSVQNSNPERAIRLYNEDLEQFPGNSSTYNNRGFCRMNVAEKNNDKDLLEDAKLDFREAIKIAESQGEGPCYGAIDNLKRADSIRIK